MSQEDFMKTMHKKDYIWMQCYQLLLKKEHLFSTLSIQDICEASGIHRSTFYRLFKDKYELLEFGIAILWKEYMELPIEKRLYQPFQTADSFYQTSEARALISHHVNDDGFNQFVTRYFTNQLELELKTLFTAHPLAHFETDLVVQYIVANIAFLDGWNRSLNKKKNPVELDSLYQDLVLPSIEGHFSF